MFKFTKKDSKDFTTVPQTNEVSEITIPTIPIKKYPVIIKNGTSIVQKLAGKMGNPEKFLDDLTVVTLLKYIPDIVDVAAKEFFSLLAYVLEVEIDKVENLSGANLMRVLIKLFEVNEMAEISGPLFKNLRGTFNKNRRK